MRNCQSEEKANAEVTLARCDSKLSWGGDSLIFGLAAQMRKPPWRQSKLVTCLHNPGGSIVGDS